MKLVSLKIKVITWLIGLLVPVILMIIGGLILLALVTSTSSSSGFTTQCGSSQTWRGPISGDFTRPQLDAAAIIYAAAHTAGVGDHGAIIGIATALQESNLGIHPLSHNPNSDGDIGLFQQRSLVGWYADGKTQQENVAILRDQSYQARNFFEGHKSLNGSHIPGLININDWQKMSVTQAAQAVQRSAFPDAYSKHEPVARFLVNQLSKGAAEAVPCTESSTSFQSSNSGAVVLPLDSGYVITSPFGYRTSPVSGIQELHTGVDMAIKQGAPIKSVMAGQVKSSGWAGGYGILTTIKSADGTIFYYAHQVASTVSVGQTVTAGQVIGHVGSTGRSTGPHLHFEVRIKGKPIDPIPWLNRQGLKP